MVSRRTNFGKRRKLAPSKGGKLQSAGGGGGGGTKKRFQFRHCVAEKCSQGVLVTIKMIRFLQNSADDQILAIFS